MHGYKIFKSSYKDDRTGERIESSTWWIEFKDHAGRRQRWKGFPKGNGGFGERRTRRLAAKLESLVECRVENAPIGDDLRRWLESVEVPAWIRERLETSGLVTNGEISRHLKGFREHLAAAGDTPDHINQTIARIELITNGVGAKAWRDLAGPDNLASIEYFLAELRKEPSERSPAFAMPVGKEASEPSPLPAAGGPAIVQEDQRVGKRRASRRISAATFNYYVKARKSFGNWMVTTDRALSSPFDKLSLARDAESEKRERRHLSIDEIKWLLNSVVDDWVGERRQIYAAGDRVLLYRFAFETGMRPNQIRGLKCSSFNLADDPPSVTSQAATVKRRKEHTQILKLGMARLLKEHLSVRMPHDPAFRMPDKFHCAEMFRHDLSVARLKWIKAAKDEEERSRRRDSDFLASTDHRGRHADFYSIRHAHGTALGDAGVPQKDIGASLHHSKLSTTERYMHTDQAARARAIDALPEFLAATGTDGPMTDNAGSNDPIGSQYPGESPADRLRVVASRCKQNRDSESGIAVTSEGDGARTRNHRIDSPVLYPIELRPRPLFACAQSLISNLLGMGGLSSVWIIRIHFQCFRV